MAEILLEIWIPSSNGTTAHMNKCNNKTHKISCYSLIIIIHIEFNAVLSKLVELFVTFQTLKVWANISIKFMNFADCDLVDHCMIWNLSWNFIEMSVNVSACHRFLSSNSKQEMSFQYTSEMVVSGRWFYTISFHIWDE